VPPDVAGVDFTGSKEEKKSPSPVSRCKNALFVIPNDGNLGWPYMDDGMDVRKTDGTIHRGLDIFPVNDKTVYAPYAGKVIDDKFFRIRHSALGVDTYYGHMKNSYQSSDGKWVAVQKDSDVKQGDPIGTIEDDHLHFAILKYPGEWRTEFVFANSLDLSPFFNAKLNFYDGTQSAGVYNEQKQRRTGGGYDKPVKNWCNNAPIGIIRGVVKTPDGKGVSGAKVEIEGIDQYRITGT
jgi:hypothetical protein